MFVTGTIRGTRSGFAFLIRDDGGEDLMVSADGLGGAIHGDHVRASLVGSDRRGPRSDFRPQVVVDEILERTAPTFTGNVQRVGKSWIVRPDSPLLPERLPLRLGTDPLAAGSKVLFRVETKAGRQQLPVAVYESTVGEASDARLDPIVIASEFGLALRFSEEALGDAEARLRSVQDADDAHREDFREQFSVTIDPIDAKDFDDAVALRRLPNGDSELSVHIADVTYYVPEGSALDREAAARGTSVYFPGSVVPMLPEGISSLAASLSPETDKRTLSAILVFSPEGERKSTRVVRGWIRSHARLHYAEAQAILDGDPGAPAALRELLADMWRLAGVLRARRFRDGAFDLDVPEAEMELGADGVPVRLWRHRIHDSNRLVEEFMIAANLAVGALSTQEELPILYRVHEEPSSDALDLFRGIVFSLLPGTRADEIDTLPRLRRWLSALPRNPRSAVLHRFFLRSLKKAHYSPEDVGHFGLGVRAYCHFTSPIRRYPDLWTHRRIKEWLDGRPRRDLVEGAFATGRASSRAEVNAEEAEREMHRLKTVRYLMRHLGEEADGFVSGVTPRGLFVEWKKIPVEGFVPRTSLGLGMRYLADRLSWSSDRGSQELRPGDAVRVQVARVDPRTRQVEFALSGVKPSRHSDRPGGRAGAKGPRGAVGSRRKGRSSAASKVGSKRSGKARPGRGGRRKKR